MQVQSYAGEEILIVEDHAVTACLLAILLAGAFPAFAVRVTSNAEEALAAFSPNLTRLVIMDINLPGMNGIEAARQIRTMSAAVGIVVHTGFETDIYRETSYAVGANAFISKSKTFKELIPAVAALLTAHPGENPL